MVDMLGTTNLDNLQLTILYIVPNRNTTIDKGYLRERRCVKKVRVCICLYSTCLSVDQRACCGQVGHEETVCRIDSARKHQIRDVGGS